MLREPQARVEIWDYLKNNKMITLRGLILFNLLLNQSAWETRLVKTAIPTWGPAYVHKVLKEMEEEGIIQSRKEELTRRLVYEITPNHLEKTRRLQGLLAWRMSQ